MTGQGNRGTRKGRKDTMMTRKLIGLVSGLVLLAASAFGATYTNFVGSATRLPWDRPGTVMVQNTMDFSVQNVATTDVVQVIGVPATGTVFCVCYDVLTTNINPSVDESFDIGDGGSTTRYKSAGSMQTTGPVVGSSTAYTYTANDTIDLVMYGTLATGKLRVWAYIGLPPKTTP